MPKNKNQQQHQKTLIFKFEHSFSRHFAVPRLPVIPGQESFPGLVMHSHDYRNPEVFQGKHLVIFGGGPSGIDICLDVANCAENVYISHTSTFCSTLPENVEQHRPIMSIRMDGTVLFEDGQERKVDSILLCTGYIISFPFLHDDCSILVRNNRVTHLYKHIFNTKYPTLSFIGVCSKNFCTFPRFSMQAQYIASVLSGRKSLPSESQMNADEEQDFQERLSLGLPEHHAHIIGTRGDYDGMIAQLAGVDRLSPVYHSLFNYVTEERFPYHLMHYKKDNFRVNSDGTWSLVKNLADFDNCNREERNAESHMDSLQNGLEPSHKRLDHQKTKH